MNPVKKIFLLFFVYLEGVALSIRSRFAKRISTHIKIDARFELLEQKINKINSK